MLTFKEFLEPKELKQLTDRAATAVRDLVVLDSSVDIEQRPANEVARSVSEVLNDEEFLKRLSDALPDPTQVASEDAFVEAAVEVARRLLYERFGV